MTNILAAVRKHAEGHVAIHKANIDVYMTNPAGIGEHSDISEAVIEELKKVAVQKKTLQSIKCTILINQ